jgi:hypothetical protein
MDQIVLGVENQHVALAVLLGLVAIALVVLIHVLLNLWSQRSPRTAQNVSGILTDWLSRPLLYRLRSGQEYTRADISPYFWINGIAPTDQEWNELAKDEFAQWQ